jgi:hypothetical protein
VLKPQAKRSLVRPKRRQEDDSKMDVRETGCEGVDWIELVKNGVQWRIFVNTLINIRVPEKNRIY